MVCAMAQDPAKIVCAVMAVFIRAKIKPNDRVFRAFLQSQRDLRHAVIVKSKAVNHGAIAGQAKQSGLGVAWLRHRGGRADFEKPKAARGQTIKRLCVFIKPGSQAYRIWQGEPGQL